MVALLVVLNGCGGKPETQASNPVLRSETPAQRAATAPAAPSGSQLSIRGPRSQAEIASIYSMPYSAAAPTGPVPRASVAGLRYSDGDVIADPRWNAQITREWRHIVVHHSATPNGSMAAFDKDHRERNGWDGVGYHFVIGNGNGSGDGEVEPTYRWRQQLQGAHAGVAEYNQHGIGICLVGDFEHSGRPTPRQMASLRALVRFLQVKTGIPTYEVVGHGDLKCTACPGRWLDMAAFRQSLGGNAIAVPIHYTQQGPASLSRPAQMARSSTSLGAALP
jgi:hypothetical protein